MKFSDLKERLYEHSLKNDILTTANIELTNCCNFACKHCYLTSEQEKSFIESQLYKSLIVQLKKLGCVNIILTGGETLLHPDFEELYIFTKSIGFIVTIFTNGFLLREKEIRLFSKHKPYSVEITMYGNDNESYENFVGQPSAYDAVLRTLDNLKKNEIRFYLKAVISKQNVHMVPDFKELARNYGAYFKLDPYVLPTLESRDDFARDNRLEPREVAHLILQNPLLKEKIGHFLSNKGNTVDRTCMYQCNPAKNNVYITSDGYLTICTLARDFRYSIKDGNIVDGMKYLQECSKIPFKEDSECMDCQYIRICAYCPSKFQLETGSMNEKSEWFCAITKEIVQQFAVMEG